MPQVPRTVLLVDDHDDSRDVYRTLLEHSGYRVIEATTGAEGRAALAGDHVDLVLLDRGLPDMDGLDLMEDIDPEAICVVTLSANPHREREREALAAGCKACLLKPVEPRDVAKVVHDLIGPARRVMA